MRKLRVAIIGISHIHVITLSRDFNRHKDLYEIVGMADVPPFTKEQLETKLKLNLPDDVELKLFDDYKELLKKDIDIAVICTDIKGHADIVEETLAMGIHTLVEKPMALSLDDAKRMYRAHKNSTAELIINWPVAWFKSFRKAKELADSGVIGDILRVHYRSPATLGPYKVTEENADEIANLWWYDPERGGGSICDYAGYGFTLTTWFAGETAKRVTGFAKNYFLPFSKVEDYSVFAIDFGKCVGVIEGSWSTVNGGGVPTGPVIYGSKGVIVSDRYLREVKLYPQELYTSTPKPEKVFIVGDDEDDIALDIAGFINEGKPLCELVTAEFNMKAAAAFDAGMRSAKSGNTEDVNDPFEIF